MRSPLFLSLILATCISTPLDLYTTSSHQSGMLYSPAVFPTSIRDVVLNALYREKRQDAQNASDQDPAASNFLAVLILLQAITEQGMNGVFAPTQCIDQHICYSNEDCRGGQCVGSFVGKCMCYECVNFQRCDNDGMCGGLKGACNTIRDLCDCETAFINAGFSSESEALITFCNTKNCTELNADTECFGLPCTFGSCICPLK